MSSFYLLFKQEPGSTRAHRKYPELRPGGWVTVVVSPEPSKDFEDLLRQEDVAKAIATEYFGTAWSSIHTQLSFDDFREGELMRIEPVSVPGIVEGHQIVRRTRKAQDGTVEEFKGVRLTVMQAEQDEIFARPKYRTIRFGGGTVEPQQGIDILRDVEISPQSSDMQFLARAQDGLWAWVGNPEFRPATGRPWVDVAGLAAALEPFGSYQGIPKEATS